MIYTAKADKDSLSRKARNQPEIELNDASDRSRTGAWRVAWICDMAHREIIHGKQLRLSLATTGQTEAFFCLEKPVQITAPIAHSEEVD